uniref:Carbonic anhydrase 6 n=1 Tax=Rhinopithecus roxellana TaxID=61622 RepID=A0A2K6Q058_RHIRO
MRALVPLLSLFLLGGQAQHGSDWTYSEGALDEAHWPQHYPACGGQRQSPINLQRTKVRYNPALKGLKLTGYETQEGEFPMVNNGHTDWQAELFLLSLSSACGERVKPKGQRQWLCSPSLDSGREEISDGGSPWAAPAECGVPAEGPGEGSHKEEKSPASQGACSGSLLPISRGPCPFFLW